MSRSPVIDTFNERLRKAIGPDLRGLSVYGRTEKRVLVIVDVVTGDLLSRAAGVVREARQSGLFVLIATRSDILTSADVFPIRYNEMRQTRRHIYGDDVLANLTISGKHLRLRTEQELKSAMFRLRQCYVTAGTEQQRASEELETIVRSATPAYELLVRVCPEAEVLADVGLGHTKLTLDPGALTLARPPGKGELESAILQFHRVLVKASKVADVWNS
jgi:hypothetical protein